MIVAEVNLVAVLRLGGANAKLAQEVLQKDPVWSAPALWRTEFRSSLAACMRQRGLAPGDAWQVHELAEALLGANEYNVADERVPQSVSSSSCSAYDCEYVALATELHVRLVTSNRQLLKNFQPIAVRSQRLSARGAVMRSQTPHST